VFAGDDCLTPVALLVDERTPALEASELVRVGAADAPLPELVGRPVEADGGREDVRGLDGR
jgi:hypothetical protein